MSFFSATNPFSSGSVFGINHSQQAPVNYSHPMPTNSSSSWTASSIQPCESTTEASYPPGTDLRLPHVWEGVHIEINDHDKKASDRAYKEEIKAWEKECKEATKRGDPCSPRPQNPSQMAKSTTNPDYTPDYNASDCVCMVSDPSFAGDLC